MITAKQPSMLILGTILKFIAALAVLVLGLLLAPLPGRSQEAPPASPQTAGSLTPAQAQQAPEVLKDDKKRAQLNQTLQTIAKASPSDSAAVPAAPSSVPSGDNLGVQLVVQVSNWIGELS